MGKATDPVAARILLIEDGATYARLARILLTEIGHTVIPAASAKDGIRMAQEQVPDLILMDMNLPDMHGYGAIKVLRGDPRTGNIPTLALTADRVQGDEVQRAREAGFDGFVEKPTNVRSLSGLLEPFLGRPPVPEA